MASYVSLARLTYRNKTSSNNLVAHNTPVIISFRSEVSCSGRQAAVFHETLQATAVLHTQAPSHPLHRPIRAAEILSVPAHGKQKVNLLGYLKSQTCDLRVSQYRVRQY